MSTSQTLATVQGTGLERRQQTIEELAGAWLLAYESERTQQAYRRDLEAFVAWATAEPRPDVEINGYPGELPSFDPLRADRASLDLYARWLEQQGLAASTRARRLASLSSFYAYASDVGAIPANPAANVRRPKVSSESPRLGLTREELAGIIQAARAGSHPERDLALVALLGLLGLRVSEACRVEAHDLSVERQHQLLSVTRKGGKAQRIPLDPFVADALEAALGERVSGPILLANDGGPFDRFDAARVIRRLARAAGIERPVCPHDLRHSFVTLALEAGRPIHVVADAAGHSDVRTTQRYDRQRHALEGHAAYAVSAFVLASDAGYPAA
jgi:integrase/recombinase XerD